MTSLTVIEKKVLHGERIDEADLLFLLTSNDLSALGEIANAIRERRYGGKTFYILNRHIDYSNVCVLKCKFCAFARKGGEAGAFEMTIGEIVARAVAGLSRGITEVHIVGGFHPTHPWEFYTQLLTSLKKAAPQIHIKAFTAAEIRYFSKKFRMTEEEVLGRLMESGLDSLPGGGAEILAEEVRKEICGPKGVASYWLDTHRRAHRMGLRSTATMLYGHIESARDRVTHMKYIRDLQDETAGFMAFIPLAFNPVGTAYEGVGHTSAIDDLKTLAASRIYFDNIDHIKAYWVMSGVAVAQMAQYFGADDLHGTVIEENITHMAGATSPQELPEPVILNLIRTAHRRPVQRDSLYREIGAV